MVTAKSTICPFYHPDWAFGRATAAIADIFRQEIGAGSRKSFHSKGLGRKDAQFSAQFGRDRAKKRYPKKAGIAAGNASGPFPTSTPTP
jgi:hypothetical protein